jgi:hypothetical protein
MFLKMVGFVFAIYKFKIFTAALNTPSTDNQMNDAEARNSTGNELRCNSSIGIEIVGYSDESTNRLKSSSQNLGNYV